MSERPLPPHKIAQLMLERGATSYKTEQGDTIYVLGEGNVSAQLICYATRAYRLEVRIDGLEKHGENAPHIAKLWSWWTFRRSSATNAAR